MLAEKIFLSPIGDPYDFQRPILWLDHADSSGKMYFKILGPAGKWRMQRTQGVKLSRLNGFIPDTISATKISPLSIDIKIDLQYVGIQVTDEFENETGAGQPYNFSYSKLYLPTKWTINYYRMDTSNPVKYPEVFTNAIKKKGFIKTDSVSKLEFTWWGAPDKNVPEDHFAVVATASQNSQE